MRSRVLSTCHTAKRQWQNMEGGQSWWWIAGEGGDEVSLVAAPRPVLQPGKCGWGSPVSDKKQTHGCNIPQSRIEK